MIIPSLFNKVANSKSTHKLSEVKLHIKDFLLDSMRVLDEI